MLMSNDTRIPVRLGTAASAGPRSHVLSAADLPKPSALQRHTFGCTCCAPRTGLARALARLFLALVRGEVPFFEEIIVVGDFDADALAAAIAEDVVAAARFRMMLPLAAGDGSPYLLGGSGARLANPKT
jgi:hypothetical protein